MNILQNLAAFPFRMKPLTYREQYPNCSNGRGRKVKCLNTGKVYNGAKDAASDNHMHESTVRRICAGRIADIRGIKFEWVEK